MSDVVFRVALPLFWLCLVVGLAGNRRRVRRQLGHDPVVAKPWLKGDTPTGYLERTFAVAALLATVDVALNALSPATVADALAIRWLRTSSIVATGGLVLLTLGLAEAAVGIHQMGSAWRVGIDHKTPGPLVSRGLFARVRHPIYGGMLLATAGLAAVTADLVSIGVAATTWVSLPVQARLEEAFLLARYPEEYPTYASMTGRFWPKMRSTFSAPWPS